MVGVGVRPSRTAFVGVPTIGVGSAGAGVSVGPPLAAVAGVVEWDVGGASGDHSRRCARSVALVSRTRFSRRAPGKAECESEDQEQSEGRPPRGDHTYSR